LVTLQVFQLIYLLIIPVKSDSTENLKDANFRYFAHWNSSPISWELQADNMSRIHLRQWLFWKCINCVTVYSWFVSQMTTDMFPMAKRRRTKKQWSTKHTLKTKDRVTWTPLKQGMRSGGTRRANLVTNPVSPESICANDCFENVSTVSLSTHDLCHKWPRICSTCRKHLPVLSWLMIYHWVGRQHNGQQKKGRQHNGQQKKTTQWPKEEGQKNNDLQNIHLKLKIESFFFWPLCCLPFFDLQILITPLVSSNSFYCWYQLPQ
jgi:hypothetical protein